jgi:4-amino-4-deoxy-L-arabinose transferase-like glycosyltransferase
MQSLEAVALSSSTREPALSASPPGLLGVLCTPIAFWSLFGIIGVLLLRAAAFRQLVPDEAYYWVWSRHPALSYFDHPPMVAWIIWLSTHAFGTSELSVRAPAVLMALGAVPILMTIARWAGADRRTSLLVGVLVLVSPVTAIVGTVITPDTPAWLFGVCAVAAAVAATRPGRESRSPLAWVAFGAFLGLALVSKYTAVLIGTAVFAALATGPDGRAHLRRPWFWAGGAVAVLLFTPVLAWNAMHEWASIKFQLHHGLDRHGPGAFRGVAEYIGGQLVVGTPVLLGIGAVAVAASCASYRRLPSTSRILIWCAVLPLAAFLLSSTRRRPEINWPVLAYAPLAVVTALYVAATWTGPRLRWAALGVNVSLVMAMAALHVDLLLPAAHSAQMVGYRDLGRALGDVRKGPIFANRYQEASEAAFYTPGRPEVWALNLGGSRPNAFDYFDGKPDLSALAEATLLDCPVEEFSRLFAVGATLDVPTKVGGKVVRTDNVALLQRRSGASGGAAVITPDTELARDPVR